MAISVEDPRIDLNPISTTTQAFYLLHNFAISTVKRTYDSFPIKYTVSEHFPFQTFRLVNSKYLIVKDVLLIVFYDYYNIFYLMSVCCRLEEDHQ